MTLPDDFWWGTVAASTQTHGAAPRSDWFAWEQAGRAPRSGQGNGFAGGDPDDAALLVEHGLTHLRISIEWARIEPRQGRRDPSAVERATEVLRTARDAGLAVWVDLHHVALPGWFSEDMGGFLDPKARGYHWSHHVDYMGETFGDLVAGWVPIHEPGAYAAAGWLWGTRPPGRTDAVRHAEALEAVHLANHEAWRLLASGDQPVATAHELSPLAPIDDSLDARSATARADEATWDTWIRMLRDGVLAVPGRAPIERDGFAGAFDVIGVSYRGAHRVAADHSWHPDPAGAPGSAAGGAAFAEGLRLCLDRLTQELPGRPLLVSSGSGASGGEGSGEASSGCPPSGDPRSADPRSAGADQAEVLRTSLGHIDEAMADGVDLKGFFWDPAMDGYGFEQGNQGRRGLFDRDRGPKPVVAELQRWTTSRT